MYDYLQIILIEDTFYILRLNLYNDFKPFIPAGATMLCESSHANKCGHSLPPPFLTSQNED